MKPGSREPLHQEKGSTGVTTGAAAWRPTRAPVPTGGTATTATRLCAGRDNSSVQVERTHRGIQITRIRNENCVCVTFRIVVRVFVATIDVLSENTVSGSLGFGPREVSSW